MGRKDSYVGLPAHKGSVTRGGLYGAAPVRIFKRRCFPVEIILLCVRWSCKYGISYRDLAEVIHERGVNADSSTTVRRQRF
ncbi:IS6 family transposase [Microvirga massiliensis]|uniref:IS6 family transposase n=1 Tax=Microvirga massiliensis TaxID=1033741 RepID=UPI00062BEFB4